MLRNPDPRFIALQEFCDSRAELKSSPIIELVNKVSSSIYYFHLMYLNSYPDIPSRARCLEGTWKGELLLFFLFIADRNILHIFRPRTRIPMSMPHPVCRLFYLLVCNGINHVRIQVVCSTITASQSSRLDESVLFSCDLRFNLF